MDIDSVCSLLVSNGNSNNTLSPAWSSLDLVPLSYQNFWVSWLSCKQTLENTEWAIKKGQPRETGNIGYNLRRRKTTQKHSTICVGHHYTQTKTNDA